MLRPVLATGNADLSSINWRLRTLGTRHAEVSGVLSLDDEPFGPSERLLDLTTRLIPRCRKITLPLLTERGAPAYVHTWPGEHYRLLVALLEELGPRTVVEIGTFTGHSLLAMLPALPAGSRLVTFDIVPWDTIAGSVLRREDFAPGRVEQVVADLSDLDVARQHAELLRATDLIFMDAAKDGSLERRLIANFETVGVKPGATLVLDDIRVWNMLATWRCIAHPKLDLTSFGHFCGTGLIDWHGQTPEGVRRSSSAEVV
jgi:predicted O-methyltransferase YrrM